MKKYKNCTRPDREFYRPRSSEKRTRTERHRSERDCDERGDNGRHHYETDNQAKRWGSHSRYESKWKTKTHDERIGEVICEGLCNEITRGFILIVEDEIKKFVTTYQSGDILLFPHMSSYHRLIIHKTAERFGVKSGSIGMNELRRIKLVKKQKSLSPVIRYSDVILNCPVELVKKSVAHFGISSEEEKEMAKSDIFGVENIPLMCDVPDSETMSISDEEMESRIDLSAKKSTFYDWGEIMLTLEEISPTKSDRSKYQNIEISDITTQHIVEIRTSESDTSTSELDSPAMKNSSNSRSEDSCAALLDIIKKTLKDEDVVSIRKVFDHSYVAMFPSTESARKFVDSNNTHDTNLDLSYIAKMDEETRAALGFPVPEKRARRDVSTARRLISGALGV